MKKIIQLLITFLIAGNTLLQGQVTIITDDPDYVSGEASAILDIKSNSKGLLVPRMTQLQKEAISEPATGLLVCQIDEEEGFYYYNGTAWVRITNDSGIGSGSNTGDMIYWDGSAWKLISPGFNCQNLTICNGIPVWGLCTPRLTTNIVTEITSNSAVSGGIITHDNGFEITARGIVWSSNQNPTLENNEGATSDGTGTGSFVSQMTGLNTNVLYFVRAYATNSNGTEYGNEVSFHTVEWQCGSPIADIDGNVYNTVLISNLCWMKENIRVTRFANGNILNRYCYDNLVSNCDIYGGLYHDFFPNSQGPCPSGWRLPYENDILNIVNNASANCMKSCRQVNSPIGGSCQTDEHPRWNEHPQHYGNNGCGFSGLPGGFYSFPSFAGKGEYGYWWTADFIDAPYLYRMSYNSDVIDYYEIEGLRCSVRCVKSLE